MSSSTNFLEFDRMSALERTADLIKRSWHSFDQARPDQPEVGESVYDLLNKPLPENGLGDTGAIDEAELFLDQSHSPTRPRFFAYVGSSGLEMGVLADAMAASYDVNLATFAGAANLIEKQALAWMSEFVGFGSPHGTFTSGGMLSNLTALTAARQKALPDSRENGVRQDVAIYISRDAHSSIERAVEILGLGSKSIRSVPIDDQRRLVPEELDQMIAADVANGVKPVAIVASIGTTLAGAVDPLDQIADIAEKYGIWIHADGAYGGPAAGALSAKPLFSGIDRIDSLTIDAHKWMFLPKPCGVLLVKKKEDLVATFSHSPSYILDSAEVENPVDWTLEYSRPLRALKVWLSLRTYGAAEFREAIERNLNQAQLCASMVEQDGALELMMAPQLSTVLFKHLSGGQDDNLHNRELAKAIQKDGRIYVAAANVDGQDCLRFCFVNYRTTNKDVRALIETVKELGASLGKS